MRRSALFTLPLLLLFFAGCADQATAPEVDLITSEKKPVKPPPEPAGDAAPVISFLGGNLRNPALQVMDADGGNQTAIYDGADFMHSSWSPLGDGTTDNPYVILVSAGGPRAQPLERLEVIVDGGVPRVQDITNFSTYSTETQRYFFAAVRPNGLEFVVVEVGDPSQEFADLVLGDMETGALQPEPLYRPAEGRWPESPTWNAEGTKVAFFESGTTEYNSGEVRIVDLESRESYRAFPVSWEDRRPTNLSWARTSNELLLDVDGLIYRVDLDAAIPALGEPIAEGTHAVWSPDDAQMAYLDKFIYVKTFGVTKDQRLPGGWYPDWRRSP